MDMRELRYFLAVFETGSLTAAARRCYVSQPSISTALAALESELETSLFIRHKKGVSPTAAAETFYPRARRLVDEAAAMSGLFRNAPAPRLTLGLSRTLDIDRTLALLTPLTADQSLQLTLVDVDEPCDARIISRTQLREDETFAVLWSEPYVVALPARHPLRFKDQITTADLAGLPLIQRCHCENAELFAQLEFRPQIAAVAPSEDWAVALVKAGVGAAVLPSGVIRPSEDIVSRPLAGLRAERQIGLAYGRSKTPAPLTRRLVETLLNASPKASAA